MFIPEPNTELKLGSDDCCGFQNVGELLLMSVESAWTIAVFRVSSVESSDAGSSRKELGILLAVVGW